MTQVEGMMGALMAGLGATFFDLPGLVLGLLAALIYFRRRGD